MQPYIRAVNTSRIYGPYLRVVRISLYVYPFIILLGKQALVDKLQCAHWVTRLVVTAYSLLIQAMTFYFSYILHKAFYLLYAAEYVKYHGIVYTSQVNTPRR